MTAIDELIDQWAETLADHEARFLRLHGATGWTPRLVGQWLTSPFGRAIGTRAAEELFLLTENPVCTADQRARIDALLALRNPARQASCALTTRDSDDGARAMRATQQPWPR